MCVCVGGAAPPVLNGGGSGEQLDKKTIIATAPSSTHRGNERSAMLYPPLWIAEGRHGSPRGDMDRPRGDAVSQDGLP